MTDDTNEEILDLTGDAPETPVRAPLAPVEPADESVDIDPADATEADSDDTDEPDDKATRAGRQAAKYRHRAKAAETELAAVTQQLEATRRGIIAQLAAAHGVNEKALFASGVEVADMVNDKGAVDPDAVAKAAQTARAELGLVRTPAPNPGQGSSHSGTHHQVKDTDPMATAFKPR